MKKSVVTMLAALAAVAGLGAFASAEGSIRLVNGKIEVDAQLKKLAEMYEAETGVKVEIESMGGGINIQDTLKGYFNGDNMPDIYVCGSDADFGNWVGHLADMSDQPWAADTDAAYINDEGTVGFPYTTEAIGLAYNKAILDAAGVDPASITGPEALKAAFETIDSKKEELGLDAVVGWCAEVTNLYWSTGSHNFAQYIDAGLDRDDTTYIDKINAGGAPEDMFDMDRLNNYAEMVGLLNQYSDPNLLVSGTYDQQILNFASGKYAFVTQGSWIGATMTTDDLEAYDAAGHFECGMVPYAFEDGIDTILTNSPSWWAVFKEGNVEEAEAFLQWLTTDPAQEVLVMEAGFVSPFKSCAYVADDPFAQTISDYVAAGKTSAWHWLKLKASQDQNATGQVYGMFAQGALDAPGFAETLAAVLSEYYAQ